MHGKCRPKREKLEAYPAGHLRRSENWPKWLVVSAKRCITREPLPLSITDHLGKVSVWPFKECKPPGTLSGQGLLSCIERVPNVGPDVNHQRPKETRQHARKATPRIPPAYYKEGLVRFTEKRPRMILMRLSRGTILLNHFESLENNSFRIPLNLFV